MISTQLLKDVISDQAQIQLHEPLVIREIFQKIDEWIDNPFIIVITGLRRCGKSTLLQMLRRQAEEQDFYINFDDDRLVTFEVTDFQKLLECFIELYGNQKTIYLDEIQNIPEWERFVRRLYENGYKVFVTGSNALMFSKELGTRLTGRYLPVEMYPFSFREFVSYFEPGKLKQHFTTSDKGKLKKFFNQYLALGSLPEYIRFQTETYLHTLFENILYKDIIARYRLTNERSIKQLAHYLASNIAKDTNFRQLGKLIQTSSSSVADYCHYFENCYLSFMINRYSPSLKQQHGYQKKVYFIDTALAKSIGFRASEDKGRLLENVVFIELKRRGHEIYFYKENKECDFIIKKGPEIIQAIQVTTHMDDVNRDREVAGLIEVMDQYNLKEGFILTEDQEDELIEKFANKDYHIRIIPVWKWLLG